MKKFIGIWITCLILSACAHKPIQDNINEYAPPVVQPRPYAINGLYLGESSTMAIQQIENNTGKDCEKFNTYQTPYYRKHNHRAFLDGKTDDYITTMQIRGMIFSNKEESKDDPWNIVIGWDQHNKLYYVEYDQGAAKKFLGFEEDNGQELIQNLCNFFGIDLKVLSFTEYLYDTREWALWVTEQGGFVMYKKLPNWEKDRS